MEHVIVYTDGASRGNPGPAGAGWLLADAEGRVFEEGWLPLGETTNNVAEYQAVIAALERARQLGARRVTLRSDSELLVQQLSGAYRVRAERLLPLYRQVRRLVASFERVEFQQVPRQQNRRADELANRGADANDGAPVATGTNVAADGAGGAGADGGGSGTTGAPGARWDFWRYVEPAVVLRVRYGETDQMGVVYYANYLDWFTEGRTELMRRHGVPYRDLEAAGIFLPVGEVECRYRRPARYDDLVAVHTVIRHVTPARLEFAYQIVRVESAQNEETGLLAEGRTVHAFVDRSGRPFNLQKRHPELWQRIQAAAARAAAGGGPGVQ